MKNAIDARGHKGLVIAAKSKLTKEDDSTWLVPSQAGKGEYQVDLKSGTCTCPDFESRQLKCKHIIAVEITKEREQNTGAESRLAEAAEPLNRAGLLTSFQEVLHTYEKLRQDFHLLTPVIGVSTILPNYAVGWQSVRIDSRPSAREVYIGPFCNNRADTPPGQRERALTALGLDRIMAAAEVRRIDQESGRVDNRSNSSRFCEYKVTLEITYLNGKRFRRSATEALDLNDGAPDTMKKEWVAEKGKKFKSCRLIPIDPNLLKAKRQKIVKLTETLATSACLRKLIGLKQVYTIDELSKDFLFFSLVWKPDMTDPETRTRLLAMSTGTTNALYGRPPQSVNVESRALLTGYAEEPLDGTFFEELRDQGRPRGLAPRPVELRTHAQTLGLEGIVPNPEEPQLDPIEDAELQNQN
jgi:hypothetical protein